MKNNCFPLFVVYHNLDSSGEHIDANCLYKQYSQFQRAYLFYSHVLYAYVVDACVRLCVCVCVRVCVCVCVYA